MIKTSQVAKYTVQCLSGHSYQVLPGSKLEGRCVIHAMRYLDALCLSFDECEQCREEAAYQERRNFEMLGPIEAFLQFKQEEKN